MSVSPISLESAVADSDRHRLAEMFEKSAVHRAFVARKLYQVKSERYLAITTARAIRASRTATFSPESFTE